MNSHVAQITKSCLRDFDEVFYLIPHPPPSSPLPSLQSHSLPPIPFHSLQSHLLPRVPSLPFLPFPSPSPSHPHRGFTLNLTLISSPYDPGDRFMILWHGTVSWYCVMILNSVTMSWYSVMILCHGSLLWYRVMILRHDTVSWHCVMILCHDTMSWYHDMVQINDTVLLNFISLHDLGGNYMIL